MSEILDDFIRESSLSNTETQEVAAEVQRLQEQVRRLALDAAEEEARADKAEVALKLCEAEYSDEVNRCMKAEAERDDARNYVAEIAQGISHYPHDKEEPCIRCAAEAALESKIGPDWREALPYESELELKAEVERLRGALDLATESGRGDSMRLRDVEARIEAALALHTEYSAPDVEPECRECFRSCPCPTVKALTGEGAEVSTASVFGGAADRLDDEFAGDDGEKDSGGK